MKSWLRSDLIGVPVTILVLAAFVLALLTFAVAGPVAGLILAGALLAGLFLVAARTATGVLGEDVPTAATASRRVLVLANEGLDHIDLGSELGPGGRVEASEVLVLAPVSAGSRSRAVADDIDREREGAQRRVDRTVRRLGRAGIAARGHVDDEGDPMAALLDGMREFPPSEVVIVPGLENDWGGAEALAQRVRDEVGVPVVELGGGPQA